MIVKENDAMKEQYIAPEANVITLEAVEKLAALDGHPESGVTRAGDIIDSNTSVGSGRPR